MKAAWGRITLMKYATDKDDGQISWGKWIASILLALAISGVWLIAMAIVRS